MLKIIQGTMLVAIATIVMSAPLRAQSRSTADSTTLDAAVSARPVAGHSALTTALGSPEAVVAAGRLGLSPDELAARIAAIDESTAQQLSDRVLAGGANVVISTTAIIIILLILILLTN